MNLALNNLQRLICHKTQVTNQLKIQRYVSYKIHVMLFEKRDNQINS